MAQAKNYNTSFGYPKGTNRTVRKIWYSKVHQRIPALHQQIKNVVAAREELGAASEDQLEAAQEKAAKAVLKFTNLKADILETAAAVVNKHQPQIKVENFPEYRQILTLSF